MAATYFPNAIISYTSATIVESASALRAPNAMSVQNEKLNCVVFPEFHIEILILCINSIQVYHVAYAIIKFANSPRAGTWVLERSSDHGKTFHPWQYFASTKSDCVHMFGIDPFEGITSDDSAICTSKHSDVVPLEGGEVRKFRQPLSLDLENCRRSASLHRSLFR